MFIHIPHGSSLRSKPVCYRDLLWLPASFMLNYQLAIIVSQQVSSSFELHASSWLPLFPQSEDLGHGYGFFCFMAGVRDQLVEALDRRRSGFCYAGVFIVFGGALLVGLPLLTSSEEDGIVWWCFCIHDYTVSKEEDVVDALVFRGPRG